MSTSQVVRKRVLLTHSTGRLKGITQIVGYLEGTAKQVAKETPTSLSYGTMKHAPHRKTTSRFIEYGEYTLTPARRLNDFNPTQR